ncbi:MAG: hypothetical protein AAF483_05485 [Planctomycetota bacterium]
MLASPAKGNQYQHLLDGPSDFIDTKPPRFIQLHQLPLAVLPSMSETHSEQSETAKLPANDEATALDWEQWLAPARARLSRRAQELSRSGQLQKAGLKASPSKPDALSTSSKADGPTNVDWRSEVGGQSGLPDSKSGFALSETSDAKQDSNDSEKRREQNLAIAQALQANAERDGGEESNLKSRSKIAGIAASIVAHILLVVLLAVVTLRMPGPPAGMSFAAASETVAEDIVELEQPIDAAEPQDSEQSQQMEPQIDVTEQFSDLSNSPISSDLIGELLPPSESLASSSAMAASAQSTFSNANAATFFGAAAGGNNFCYVIDGSGSMRGGPWTAARGELLKSLASLKPKQRFYVIIFTRSLEVIPEPGEREPAARALYATPENLEHARRWLMGVKIGNSGGPPKKAIEFAIEKEPDAIYLLTDGVTSVKDVAETIRDSNTISDLILGEQIRVPIHTIAYYSLKGERLLRQIAMENKGQFIYVPDPSP